MEHKRRVWFTSDLHISHTNIIGLSDRPFKNIDEMRQVLVANINKKVKPNDVLYLLGDICLGKKQDWVDLLDAIHCKNIIVVQGNHDSYKTIPKDRVLAVVSQCTIRVNGQVLLLCHHPYRITVWRAIKRWRNIRSFKHLRSLFDKVRPRDTGLWLLHGHTHAKTVTVPYHPRMINIGVDANQWSPVSAEDVIKIIQRAGHGGSSP
jgi:calcineurin-like phosphoesterase family protein